MKKATRILIVEDMDSDAELAERAIRKVLKGCTFHLVETRKDFLKALETFQPDVILADYALPHFDGITALKLARKHAPFTPLIIWTGANSEDVAVDCLKAGANNYVLKENLKRLGPAVRRALEDREALLARERTEEELQTNEKRFRALIENGLDDISLLAADGTLLWESPSTVRNLGYPPGEYVARNIFEIMHPDDLAWTRNVLAKLIQEAGGRESGIFRLRRSDGTWRWVEAIATNLLNEPGINAVVINYRDITERRQIEEALREERNLLRTLIDNLPDRIYAMDIHGRKTLSNTADWQACGVKAMEEVIGKTDFDIYPSDLAAGFWQLNRTVLESGQAGINHEEPGLDAEGNRVSILTTKIPLRDSEGKVVGLVGIGHDITERKQVEERINDLLAFNDKMLNHLGVGILTYKVSGQCVFANEKAASIVGTTVEQLLAQNFQTIQSWKSSGLYDLVEKAITSLSPTTEDIHHISTFGKEVWMTVHSITFKVKGEDHVLLSISDITERKLAEEKLRQGENRYRLAVKATNDVIWEANLQPKQLFWSENAQTVFGYTPQEVDSYETWWDDRLHPDDRERILSKISSLIESDESLWMDEYRFQLKNGSYAYISDRGYIERDRNGTPLRMIGAMTDITERKEAEAKLRESENRLFMALSGAQMSVWEWDLKTNQIFWSPEFFKITGVNEDQFGGTFDSFTDLIHHEDMERVRNAAENAMREQTLFAEEFRIICPDGEVRWLSNLGQAEYDSTGSYLRLIGTVQDVTQRKQAEIERQVLLEIMQGFANTEDLHKLLELIHHSVARVVYAKNFFIILYQPETGLFEEIYSVDQYDPPAPPDKLEKSITSYVFRTGEPLLLTQVLFDDLVQRGEIRLVGTDSASWLGVPLKTSGRTIGVMVVQDYEIDNRYSERDKHFLASIATQVALAIERKQAEELLRRRAEENSILLKTSLALTNLDLKATLQTVGDSAKNLFAADGCRIFLMEPDGKSLRCVLALQESLDAFSELKIKIGEGVTGTVAASGQAEIVNEMQNDPRSMQVPGTAEEEEAIMFAPLKERDNTVGVLSVRRTGSDRPFQPADLALLEALASMAASAVSNAHLFAETQRRLSELEALYENGLAVGRLLKPNQIGNRLINTFSRYLPWHHVTIRLRQEASEDLELVAFSLPHLKEEERTNAEQHFIARINKVGQGLSGWVIQTGTPFRTGNVSMHPQYIDTHAEIQSGLYMPLKVGERIIGVISVESEVPDAFTEQDERLLATLANQAAIAFENARLYQAIEQELSERKRAQEALLLSETHYRELADSITDIFFELDHELCYTHWNKASEIFSGIAAADAIGRSMQELFGTSEAQSRREEIYKSVLNERQARSFEMEILAKGQKRALEINAYPSARGVSVVAKDVTDRKRSEIIMQKRFELMEYSAHHSLDELMQRTVDEVSELTASTVGFFHFVQEDQKTLGMQTWSTNALELFNVSISEGAHLPLDQAGVWAEAVRQRRPLIQNEYEMLPGKKGFPQGHVLITREIVIPIIRNEKVMAVMGIGNKPQEYTSYDLEVAARLADYAWDITERKQMQVALELERNQLAKRVEERTTDLSQANSNLARALRVKDEFLANMSHELRTPLNAILGLSESLGEQIAGPLNEKQQKYITTISESGHHLLSLINDILDLAKIEAGQITLDINKVDIHQVCQASLRMIKQLAQKKNQEVVLEIGDEVGLMWADERRLKQMIVNLLGNAVKFTPEHGKIGLEVHGDQAANKVTITVWDNGIGIKEEDLARLFQPFVQLDSGLAREATGTGLGLALVAQMARLHGGSVGAVSVPGEGSRFSIILPWEPGLAMDASSRLRITGKFPAIKPDETNKPTVLLVEDTKEVIMMIRDYLELAGYKVVIARDGVEAIAQARLIHPDLILMDVMMPRMDGFEATRKLRSEPEFKYTPIIALTALAMPSDRERCLAAGMDEYISKPINLKALVRMIQSCLFNSKEPKPG